MLSALPLLLVALFSGVATSTPLSNTDDFIVTPVEDLGEPDFSIAEDFCYFAAYSGSNCDGATGSNIRVNNNACVGTDNRHSFRLSGCRAGNTVWVHDISDCGSRTPNQYTYDNGCYGVNTGKNWRSTYIVQN